VGVDEVDLGGGVAVEHVVDVSKLVLELAEQLLVGGAAGGSGLGLPLLEQTAVLGRGGLVDLLQVPADLLHPLMIFRDESVDGERAVVDQPAQGVSVVDDIPQYRGGLHRKAVLPLPGSGCRLPRPDGAATLPRTGNC
jgi:hypothetical protein